MARLAAPGLTRDRGAISGLPVELEHRFLHVGAPDVAETIDDLPHRGPGADQGDGRLHEVGGRVRGRLRQPVHEPGDLPLVAPGPAPPPPGPLADPGPGPDLVAALAR